MFLLQHTILNYVYYYFVIFVSFNNYWHFYPDIPIFFCCFRSILLKGFCPSSTAARRLQRTPRGRLGKRELSRQDQQSSSQDGKLSSFDQQVSEIDLGFAILDQQNSKRKPPSYEEFLLEKNNQLFVTNFVLVL